MEPIWRNLCIYLIYLIVFVEADDKSAVDYLNQLQTVSEGSDCRCSCKLNTEDGGPCENDVGARKLIFSVQSSSEGSHCRCRCISPVLNSCEAKRPKPQSYDSTTLKKNYTAYQQQDAASQKEINGNLVEGIDLIKIFSSFSKILSALSDMEQAFGSEFKWKSETLQGNIEKINAALKLLRNKNIFSNPATNEMRSSESLTENLINSTTIESVNVKTNPKGIAASSQEEIINRENTDEHTIAPLLQVNSSNTQDSRWLNRMNRGEDLEKHNNSTISPAESETGVSRGDSSVSNDEIVRPNIVPITQNPAQFQSDKNAHVFVNISSEAFDSAESGISVLTNTSTMTSKRNVSLKISFPERFISIQEISESPNVNSLLSQLILPSNATNTTYTSITSTPTTSYSTATVPREVKMKSKSGLFEPYRSSASNPPVSPKKSPSRVHDYYANYYDYNTPTYEPSPLEGEREAEVEEEFNSSSSSKPQSNSEHVLPSTLAPKITQSGRDNDTETPVTSATVDDAYDSEYDYYASYSDGAASTTSSTSTLPPTTTTNSAGECGTLLNLSKPRTVHDFGRREGAWMQDPEARPGERGKIYVTNFYYGNNLIEFESIERFKSFRWKNSHILPYNWIGTGHIVYNGSFFYNRAFSKNLIKYDLRYRFVSAWGHLRNAVYDSSTPFTWRGHTMVHMAADQGGLWVIYPAYDEFNSNVETYVVNRLNPTDLRTLAHWNTSLRRSSVSHLFMVCGVVYATDRYDRRIARITHAYDTYTGVRRALYLPFINKFSYNVQLLFHHKERKLLSWDNGHQVVYDVNLTQ